MAHQETARATPDPSRWFRSALPEVLIGPSEGDRTRRDRIVDTVMYAAAFGIGAIGMGATWTAHPPWLRVVDIVVALAALGALRWRRTHPAAVGLWAAALSILFVAVTGPQFVATFNAAIRARGRDVTFVAALTVVSCFTIPWLYPGGEGYWVSVGIGHLCTGVVLGWGLFVRARRELVRSLLERAERAEVEARAAERRRIAREMHDVLAHRISLLSVHAGALEFRPGAPAEEVAEAAGVIRESARAALEELREVIGVLREDGGHGPPEPPQPTLADLAALVEESRTAGMRLTAQIEVGDAAVPIAVGRTAYRIAQEGLTNARKHAPEAAVTLAVTVPEERLDLEIRSRAPVGVAARSPRPPGVAAGSPLPGTGTGLVGLAERVSLAGGELEHGVDPEGAFVLRARLPR